jgi:hypothetical protein
MEHRLLVRTLGSAVRRNEALISDPLVPPAQSPGRRSHEPIAPGLIPAWRCLLASSTSASGVGFSRLSSAGRSTSFIHDSLDTRRTVRSELRTVCPATYGGSLDHEDNQFPRDFAREVSENP